ncbi:MAG: hypothetical protein LBG66_02845, partial [Gallionellaceae bacterium]|nr:hypothetical protein [Gallionellaceae bacterium]
AAREGQTEHELLDEAKREQRERGWREALDIYKELSDTNPRAAVAYAALAKKLLLSRFPAYAVPPKQPGSIGVYSMFDDNQEAGQLVLTKNGYFSFGISLGMLGAYSAQGRWTEQGKGAICLTVPTPQPLLFGSRADDVPPDSIRVSLQGNAQISWGSGPRDGDIGSSRDWLLKKGTPALSVQPLTRGDEDQPTSPVYRFALNQKYNDYRLIAASDNAEKIRSMLADVVFDTERAEKNTASAAPANKPLCGAIASRFMRRDFAPGEEDDWSKRLKEAADPTTLEDDGLVYTRISGEIAPQK